MAMTIYTAPIRDFQFLLQEVFHANDDFSHLSGFEEIDEEVVTMVMEGGARVCEEILHPINASGDSQGCLFNDGRVTTPEGFREAYQAYTEAGWSALSLPAEHGGQALPETLNFVVEEMTCSANTAFSLYSVLTRGVVNLLHTYASDNLKDQYLDKLVAGTWTGTMCLTESHAGTDLGMVKTKAIEQGDGSFLLSGTKIFITGGEHDLTENIIHLVLARLPGAPEGVRGVSLFLVPKYLPNAQGDPGQANGVSCGSIEHKMGIQGSSTCVMNFDQARGFLVGQLNQGIPHMFKLMNLARLAIGLQGLGLAEVAYQNAVAYARERLQTRSLAGVKNPDGPADPIIVHADVRRMLLITRAYTEGCRALSLWTGLQLDIAHRHPEESQRAEANDLIELITPVFKAFFTDMGYETTTLCQQVFGGHGYIRETGMEQFVRDARIAQIYEGTNGIQALDLVRRKLFIHDQRLPEQLFSRIDVFIAQHQDALCSEYIKPLNIALLELRELTAWLIGASKDNPDELGAASTDYLRVFALTTLAWFWARMACVAVKADGDPFYVSKLASARYFFARLLPQTQGLNRGIRTGASYLMNLDDTGF
jgi:alkylation response protein AidB-like acyl-CoA dehydrogenase